MIAQVHAFEPDYAIPPGAILEEALEARGLSKSEFAAVRAADQDR